MSIVVEPCTVSLHHHLCESYRWGHFAAAPPQEVVSEPRQRQDSVCVNGKAEGVGQGGVGLMASTGWKVKCYLLIKQNRNVVVTVSGNLHWKKLGSVMRWLLYCIGAIQIKTDWLIDWLIDWLNSIQNSHKYSESCFCAKMFVWGL